jgi:hypothetical protein
MTPPAATPAARGKKAARSTGHRRAAAPAAKPRRVSGPSGGVGGASAPARPRRTSGPSRRPGTRTAAARPVSLRVGQSVRRLADHRLLDQVVRGRAWIPILGILLAGIVAMQVEVLKLSANMGRSLARGTALQSRNEQLRASVAQLGDDQRIERIAATMGMVMPAPTAVKFLARRPASQMSLALAGIHSPNPTAFVASLAASQPPASTASTASTTVAGTTAVGTLPAVAPAVSPASAATTPGVPSSVPTSSGTAVTPTSSPAPVTPAPTSSAPTGTAPTGTASTGTTPASVYTPSSGGAAAPGAGG